MAHNMLYTNKQINIPYLVKIGPGKTEKIGKYLYDKNFKNISLFWSPDLEKVIGDKLYNGLKKHKIKILHKQDVFDIAVEDITKTAFNLSPKTDAILGIGGGKALDYAKYCSSLLKIPFISVPTSTSNDGFCSPTSSLTVAGKRKTVKSNIPFGIVIDLDIIKSSPEICLYSGIGDMVSKITALHDWKTAAEKGLARYNDFASLISYNSMDLLFLRHSIDIHSSSFQRSLATSLMMSGIAMEIAGTSRPASGSEHLISHALDKLSKQPKMHGVQVGIATYLCALLQNNENAKSIKYILEKTGFINLVSKNPFNKKEFLEALKEAPNIKTNYYTVLSKRGYYKKACELIENDIILKSVIK